jgi:hypothetical protein
MMLRASLLLCIQRHHVPSFGKPEVNYAPLKGFTEFVRTSVFLGIGIPAYILHCNISTYGLCKKALRQKPFQVVFALVL